jgi:hypothetical protein
MNQYNVKTKKNSYEYIITNVITETSSSFSRTVSAIRMIFKITSQNERIVFPKLI